MSGGWVVQSVRLDVMFRVSAVSDLAEALLPDLSFAGLSKKSKQADSEDERGEWSRVIVGHVQRMAGPGRGETTPNAPPTSTSKTSCLARLIAAVADVASRARSPV